jgi:hypothetical protein
MLDNDELGCCVIASMMHTAMQLNANAGRPLPVPSNDDVVAAYSAIGGYVAGDPSTDNGASILDALKYWRNSGIAMGGHNHKIGAFVKINIAEAGELETALWLFGSVVSGFQLPIAAQGASAWSGVPADLSGSWAPGTWGGHCVCQADFTRQQPLDVFATVTWGELMLTGRDFINAYCDEAYVVLSDDWLNDEGQCAAGLDKAALLVDLQKL